MEHHEKQKALGAPRAAEGFFLVHVTVPVSAAGFCSTDLLPPERLTEKVGKDMMLSIFTAGGLVGCHVWQKRNRL